MSSLTTNYDLYKPADGDGDNNSQNWTDEFNANLDTIDTALKDISDAVVAGSGDTVVTSLPTPTGSHRGLRYILRVSGQVDRYFIGAQRPDTTYVWMEL